MRADTITYKFCEATNCQVGFDTFFHSNSIWENIKTSKCGTALLIDQFETRVLTCNPCSECNPPQAAYLINKISNNTFKNVKKGCNNKYLYIMSVILLFCSMFLMKKISKK